MLTFITINRKIYTNIVDFDFKTIIIMCPWIHYTINWIKKNHKHKWYRCYNHVHTQLSCKFSLKVLFPCPNSTSKLDVVSEATCISIAITSIANPHNLLSTCSDQCLDASIANFHFDKNKGNASFNLTTFQILHVWWKDVDKILNCTILFWKAFFVFFWVMVDLWFCGGLETFSCFILHMKKIGS